VSCARCRGSAKRRAKPVDPAGEVSCESRGGRSSNDASSKPRRPVLEGVWTYSAYTVDSHSRHTPSYSVKCIPYGGVCPVRVTVCPANVQCPANEVGCHKNV
jgi:hypothetical protein